MPRGVKKLLFVVPAQAEAGKTSHATGNISVRSTIRCL